MNKQTKISMLLIAVLMPILVFGQVDTVFTSTWGPAGNRNDRGFAMALNGSYIYVAGQIETAANIDWAMLCVNTAGDSQWVSQYAGSGNNDDFAYDVVCGGNNVYAAGLIRAQNQNFGVISYPAAGDTNWTFSYNGSGNNNEWANAVAYGTNGNIYAAGTIRAANRDIGVICLNPAGDTVWTYRYNGSGNGNDEAYDIVYGSDNNIYVCGLIRGANDNFGVISLTNTGTQRWVFEYNGSGNNIDVANALVYGSDGSLYVAGTIRRANNDIGLVKLNPATGESIFVRCVNGPSNNVDAGNALVYANGAVYVAGILRAANDNFGVVSFNATTGDTNWTYAYNGSGNNDEWANAITFADGYVYATGCFRAANLDIGTVCLTTAGDTCWTYRYNGSGNNIDEGMDIVAPGNRIVYVAGYARVAAKGEDIAVLGLRNITGVAEEQDRQTSNLLTVTPNPFRTSSLISYNVVGQAAVKLAVYDVTGKLVQTLVNGTLAEGQYSVNWDCSNNNLSNGVYIIKLDIGSQSSSQRVTFVR